MKPTIESSGRSTPRSEQLLVHAVGLLARHGKFVARSGSGPSNNLFPSVPQSSLPPAPPVPSSSPSRPVREIERTSYGSYSASTSLADLGLAGLRVVRSGRARLRNHLDLGGPCATTSVVGSLVDYDKHYWKGRGQCGEPFAEFVAFFGDYDQPRARVLDLGCGQGRDALLAARHGHEVVGVDLSEIGIAQMVEDAEAERLDVTGVVSDVLDFRSRRKFDVVLLDRVLHLLLDDDERVACIDRAARFTRKGGYLLVADVSKNRPLIHGYFDERQEGWTVVKRTRNYSFALKI